MAGKEPRKIKYVVLLGDGMADRPLRELDGRTPLQVARTPNMDRLARGGEIGLVKTVPDGFSPGSDVANLAVLGYSPVRYFTGRAPLEAASMGVTIQASDVAFRCNLVTLEEERMIDFSAGHITTREAKELIDAVHRELSDEQVSFYPGVSYRHLMVWRKGKNKMVCTPPHDITGMKIREYLPSKQGSEFLRDLMLRSRAVLLNHPVNRERIRQGKRPGNSIWLWGQGRRPLLPTFRDLYGLEGAVISAVDLIKGIGIYAGLVPIPVPGATGFFDTNYHGKALAALDALSGKDFVYVHVEAADEAGHIGDIREKIRAIENFDEKVVGFILKGLEEFEVYRILLLPDHPTPIELKTHSADMSPYVIYDNRNVRNSCRVFDEEEARRSGVVLEEGHKMMDRFIRNPS